MARFIKAKGIFYPREIESFKRKKGNYLQPIFEAVTNAWEAIMDKYGIDNMNKGEITITLSAEKDLELDEAQNFLISTIKIEDNGIGLNEENFYRLQNLRDPTKGHSNNGTGRIQFLFHFGSTVLESVSELNDKTSKRVKAVLSKNDMFMANNSIMRVDEEEELELQSSFCSVTFQNTLDPKDVKAYGALTAATLKTNIINHTLARLCDNRNSLPKICIERYVNGDLEDRQIINESDIPNPQKEDDVEVKYVVVRDKKITQIDENETFHLRAFVLPEHKLEGNKLFLVSKGELGTTIPLENLTEKETVDGYRYLFLLSGSYLDECDSDDRGNIQLVKETDFKKLSQEPSFLPDEKVILKENLIGEVNHKISTIFDVFAVKEKEKEDKIRELQEMFLLDPKTVDNIRSKVKKNTTDAEILRMAYEHEMEKVANIDASIKEAVKKVESLDPRLPSYQEEMQMLVRDCATKIPEQNKSAITKYIARRKLVLELFDKILHNEIECLKGGKRIDEDLLHNLIFKQHSTNPYVSDLWLLDDQYLYFEGCSEKELNKIVFGTVNLLKQELNEEEKEYKSRHEGKDVGTRRPDILLYPAEGKCVIVEFKAPEVDVSDYLDQINRYAMIIHNLADPKFKFDTFYGYLIGENIDYYSIQESNSYFKEAANLGFIFRPNYPVPGRFGHKDGDLYTEIIRYTELLKRAQDRNRVFIEKLEQINT